MLSKPVKAALALNLAGIVRALRFGVRHGGHKLVKAFDAIDPFGTESGFPDETIAQLASLPVKRLDQLVPASHLLTVDSGYQFIDGALRLDELTVLLSLLRDAAPKMVFEIGTYFGSTTKAMALNVPDAHVHTLDLPPGFNPEGASNGGIPMDDFHLIRQRRVGYAFTSDPAINNVTQHFGDSAVWDYSPVQGAAFVFIDGSHTYEYVKADTANCLAVCAPKARIVWHDVEEGHPGVVRFLDEFRRCGNDLCRIERTSLAVFDFVRK